MKTQEISFTNEILQQITNTMVSLHSLLDDITSRSDMMAQELNAQQDRIDKLEKMINEKDNPRQPARYPSEYKEWFRRARLNSENL